MERRRRGKGTYSKVRQTVVTEEDRRKRYKERKVIPKFDNLFLPQSKSKEDSDDPFDCLVDNKKLTGILEDSNKTCNAKSFESVGHCSANNTFDNLIKIKRLPARTTKTGTDTLSSSSSATDTTGILFQSLRSNAPSYFLSSAEENSKPFKKDSDCLRKVDVRGVNSEDNKENKCSQKEHTKNIKKAKISPSLFFDEEKETEERVSAANNRLCAHSPDLFSSAEKKAYKDAPKPEIGIGNNKAVEDFMGGEEESLSPCIGLYRKRVWSHNSKGLTANVHKNDEYVNGRLSVHVEEVDNAVDHPRLGDFGELPSCVSPNNFEGFSRTPVRANFAKVFLKSQFLSSQKNPLLTSQFSQVSQDSDKSSGKSALTSTPVDTSRIRCLEESFGIGYTEGNEAISPVPMEGFKLSGISSSTALQSPLINNLKTLSLEGKGSRCKVSGSEYHTCVSNCCGSSSSDKSAPHLLESKRPKAQNLSNSAAKMSVNDKVLNFCNSLDLKNDIFKVPIIPEFDPTGEVSVISHGDDLFLSSCDGDINTKPGIPVSVVNIAAAAIPDTVNVGCGNYGLHEISRNISSGMEREINSFLSRPSVGISLRTRQQKRKYSKNKVEPLPLVKRLTRQCIRFSEIQKIRSQNHDMLQSENGSTDQSTTTEPSFLKLRKRKSSLRKRESSLKKRPTSMAVMHSVRKDIANSSVESLVSSRESVVLGKRTSLRLAMKRKTGSVDFNKRHSVRLALKRKNNFQLSTDESLPHRSTDDSVSHKFMEKVYVSNRVNTRKAREEKDVLSIMQFSVSSVKSINSDFKESESSAVLDNTLPEKDSLLSTMYEQEKFGRCQVIEEENDKFSESSDNLTKSEIQKVTVNDTMKSDFIENVCVNQAEHSLIPHKDPGDVSVSNSCGLSNLDASLDEVFDRQFKNAVPGKRGKGWIRSLSIARASLYGCEQLGGIRRNTVHRMSIGRRLTLVGITGTYIKEEESCNSEGGFLSRSILEDPERHVLALCSQTEPLPIADCFTESRMCCCKKIGEGVYGEVFMTKPNPNTMDGATVLKIMPIEGDFDVNGEPQKRYGEILSEIIISLELSNLRNSKEEKDNWTENFVHVLNCWCVKGSYQHDMVHLWDLYHQEKGSENDRPDIFPDTQLYIVLEFTHGGRDLEGFVFNNAGQALAIFLQIAYTLAVAEQELEFEHRDLHWGNVLIATTAESHAEFIVNGGTYTLETKGVMATVIDFTLSRLKTPHSVMYNNLAEDPSLFTAEGDYQFEIYRQMKKVNANNWESFNPYTNILWLHYIVDKMISECYYNNVKSRIHKSGLVQLKKLKDSILDSESATAFVLRREHSIT